MILSGTPTPASTPCCRLPPVLSVQRPRCWCPPSLEALAPQGFGPRWWTVRPLLEAATWWPSTGGGVPCAGLPLGGAGQRRRPAAPPVHPRRRAGGGAGRPALAAGFEVEALPLRPRGPLERRLRSVAPRPPLAPAVLWRSNDGCGRRVPKNGLEVSHGPPPRRRAAREQVDLPSGRGAEDEDLADEPAMLLVPRFTAPTPPSRAPRRVLGPVRWCLHAYSGPHSTVSFHPRLAASGRIDGGGPPHPHVYGEECRRDLVSQLTGAPCGRYVDPHHGGSVRTGGTLCSGGASVPVREIYWLPSPYDTGRRVLCCATSIACCAHGQRASTRGLDAAILSPPAIWSASAPRGVHGPAGRCRNCNARTADH